MPSKVYKDYKIYCCFALNRLVGELDIDLYQADLEEKLDDILDNDDSYLTKEDIKHEIRSNHYMTNKVIDQLVEDGFVEINKLEKSYRITITKKGVLHIRKYNTFYKQIYSDQIKEHYKFRELPHWIIKA
ncbi:MAG: hypothetical protein KAR39_07890 [Thermoplasmata archaeon]|nr:hypothetical protein [Thermoplasmata archaeon]